MLSGQGFPPTKFPTKIIAGALNKEYSGNIRFRNPFKQEISVNVTLEGDEQQLLTFDLLLQKKKQTLAPLSSLEIPFGFRPKQISTFICSIVVTMNEKLVWKFPIKGVTESKSLKIMETFMVKCRRKLQKELRLTLPGLADLVVGEPFLIDFADIPEKHQSNIRKWLKITPIKDTLDSVLDELIFNVEFIPMKPLTAVVGLMIFKHSGGRWKFKVNLKSTMPDVDDFITIRSPLNQTASI